MRSKSLLPTPYSLLRSQIGFAAEAAKAVAALVDVDDGEDVEAAGALAKPHRGDDARAITDVDDVRNAAGVLLGSEPLVAR